MSQSTDLLASALLRALRHVDYVAGGDDDRDDPAQVVGTGLQALIDVGYGADFICEDTQFDRNQLPSKTPAQKTPGTQLPIGIHADDGDNPCTDISKAFMLNPRSREALMADLIGSAINDGRVSLEHAGRDIARLVNWTDGDLLMTYEQLAENGDKHAAALLAEHRPTLLNAGQSLAVYVEAYAYSDTGDGPGLAAIDVNAALIARLERLRALCAFHGLTEVRVNGSPDWGPRGIADQLRLQNHELVVTPAGDFWYVAQPKDADYHVETRAIGIDDLLRRVTLAVKAGESFVQFGEWDDEDAAEFIDNYREAVAGTSPSP